MSIEGVKWSSRQAKRGSTKRWDSKCMLARQGQHMLLAGVNLRRYWEALIVATKTGLFLLSAYESISVSARLRL